MWRDEVGVDAQFDGRIDRQAEVAMDDCVN